MQDKRQRRRSGCFKVTDKLRLPLPRPPSLVHDLLWSSGLRFARIPRGTSHSSTGLFREPAGVGQDGGGGAELQQSIQHP